MCLGYNGNEDRFMKRIMILIVITMLFLISCESRKNTAVIERVLTGSDDISEIENFNMPRKGLINADCDYYLRYETKPAGKFKQGQEIILMGYHYTSGFDVKVQVKTLDSNIEGYVFEKNVTRLDNVNLNLWCKDIMLIRDYYYSETVENIFNNDYGKGLGQDPAEREEVLRLWRAFYSEYKLYISNNVMIMGNDEDSSSFLLESVKKEGNTYTICFSQYPNGKFDLTIVDKKDGIILTQYVIKNELLHDPIRGSLNYKYVPRDNDKSEKVKDAVMAWCDEQIRILSKNTPSGVFTKQKTTPVGVGDSCNEGKN
jgi:hypothetical protein